jgi:hypothetical protein
VSITSGTAYTATARLQLGTSATVTLNMSNAAAWSGGVNPSATVNLSTGAITGVAANTTAKVETLPGGWFAVSITATAAATTTSSLRVVPVSSASTTSVWGLQLEAGAFATSYIPTGAASATRAADVVTCTGAAFSSWFNSTEGTFVFEAVLNAATTSNVNLAQGSARPLAYKNSGDSSLYSFDGATVLSYGTVTIGAAIRAGISFDATGRSAVINGGTVNTGSHNGQLLSSTSIALGSTGCWTIKRIRYWRKRLTNAQLQALTA